MTIKIRILAIFGETHDIDLTEHKNALESLPGVEVVDLKNKKLQEITNKLRYEKWSVVFFAGHSQTNLDDDNPTGLMQINQDDKITIDNLQLALRRATENGLKLAIFNSCDGTGLARKALEFGVPRIIVFREQVPNKVAAEFVKCFFQEFQTRPLHLALREAREGLEGLQDKFPCATWLPILFKNSHTPTLTWDMLGMEIIDNPPPIPIKNQIINKIINSFKIRKKALLFTFLVVVAILGAFVIHGLINPPNPKPTAILPCDALTSTDTQLSCGEKPLITDQENITGIGAYSQQKYEEAIKGFDTAFNQEKKQGRNNPEALIFKNNAQIMFKLQKKEITEDKIRTIVVTVPHNKKNPSSTSSISKAILQGTAQRIDKFNKDNPKIQLLVLIATEGNNVRSLQITAKKLVEFQKDIIAVIGCYSSKMTTELQEYFANNNVKMIVISGHTTRRINDPPKLNNPELENKDYFFRVVTSTLESSGKLAEYLLQTKNIQKIALLAGDDSFAKSFKNSFEEQWNGSFSSPLNYDLLKNDTTSDQMRKEILEKAETEKATALMLCTRAFTQDSKNKKDDGKDADMARQLIQLNQGKLLIAVCNTGSSLYNREKMSQLDQPIREKLLVVVPWYPKNNKIQEYDNFQWQKESDTDLMRYALAHDATTLLTDAITELNGKNQGKIPTSEEIKNLLDSNQFSTIGLTGKITIKDHERDEKQDVIITPKCENQNCEWTRTDEQ
jgi:branched-chain amino acid transport system substrate-binding protein